MIDTYQDNTLGPSAGPLPTHKGDPVPLAHQRIPHGDARIDLDAHPEIKLQRGRRQLQRPRDVSLGEGVEEVIGRDGVFHDIQIVGALQQVLALPTGIFSAHLLTVDTLYGQALM